MKFVFNQDPTSVQRKLPQFTNDLEGAFAQPLKFNIYDTEFYSQVDGSIDFGRTSSCFQIMSDDRVVDLETSKTIFNNNESDLKDLYETYSIVQVEVRYFPPPPSYSGDLTGFFIDISEMCRSLCDAKGPMDRSQSNGNSRSDWILSVHRHNCHLLFLLEVQETGEKTSARENNRSAGPCIYPGLATSRLYSWCSWSPQRVRLRRSGTV